MKLLHYSSEPFRFDLNRKYSVNDHWKPTGLWLSVEGDADWREWCEGIEFNLENLKCVAEVMLKPDANVLLIDTTEKFDTFHSQFGTSKDNINGIAWDKVKAIYDGLIIAPYLWERRLTIRRK